MSREQSRWFPEERPSRRPRLEPGWTLVGGEWESESAGGAELELIRLNSPHSLLLGLRLNGGADLSLVFEGVVDFQFDGQLALGERGMGSDVLETSMLVGRGPRADGCLVYFMELANAIVCFASQPGFEGTPNRSSSA